MFRNFEFCCPFAETLSFSVLLQKLWRKIFFLQTWQAILKTIICVFMTTLKFLSKLVDVKIVLERISAVERTESNLQSSENQLWRVDSELILSETALISAGNSISQTLIERKSELISRSIFHVPWISVEVRWKTSSLWSSAVHLSIYLRPQPGLGHLRAENFLFLADRWVFGFFCGTGTK